MPNWCSNQLKVTGSKEAIETLIKRIKRAQDEEEEIELFEQYFPMPEVLKGTISGSREAEYKSWCTAGRPTEPFLHSYIGGGRIINPNDVDTLSSHRNITFLEQFKQYDKAIAETGYTSWYLWCINNWGTKWDVNAVDIWGQEDTEVWFGFQTAWSPPHGFYCALCSSPGVEIVDAMFYEPGCGFVGRSINGTLINEREVSSLSLEDLEEMEDLNDCFDLHHEIMLCSPLQLYPEYKELLDGLGIDDCWEVDEGSVASIYSQLKGEEIEKNSIKMITKDGDTFPKFFSFKGKEYSIYGERNV